jgi:fatty-acyl-CoA synthase
MTHLKVNRTELTPVSFLVRSAYVFPDKAAVVHGSRRYTYRQLAERVDRLASALRTVGLQKHDRVAFLCPKLPIGLTPNAPMGSVAKWAGPIFPSP